MKSADLDIGYDKPLTTHSARQSYTIFFKRTSAPLSFIGKTLGHKSLLTTESCLDSIEDDTRRTYAQMLASS